MKKMEAEIEIAYRKLAESIIKTAISDWQKLIKSGRENMTPSNHLISYYEIEKFIKSDWWRELTELDPDVILEALINLKEGDPQL